MPNVVVWEPQEEVSKEKRELLSVNMTQETVRGQSKIVGKFL